MRTLIGTDGDAAGQVSTWPSGRAWTRLTMLRTLDGGVAGADGRSRSVSSVADREVLDAVRRFADAVVIGAETMRAERYGPMLAQSEDASARAEAGLASAPVLVIVSGSLQLPWDEAVFSDSTLRPLVVTGDAASPAAHAVAQAHAEVLTLPGARVSAPALLQALHERGLLRVVCEGGPGLLADFARERLVDEVCLTLAPRMPSFHPTGGASPPTDIDDFVLTSLMEHESFLFGRYLRADHAAACSPTQP